MYMYIKYKLSDFVYDFVHAKICTCTKVYYSFIRKCTADIGHRRIYTLNRIANVTPDVLESVQLYLDLMKIKIIITFWHHIAI